MNKAILFLMRRRPYASTQSEEALEAALVGGVFEQNISVLFRDDGVWQLVKAQDGALLNAKTVLKTASALPEYGIEKLYVCSESLQARGLGKADLGIEVELLSYQEQQQLVAKQNVVVGD